ncbi:unnamed protein product [Schistosoma turkestanicum]|nr:unnamed protein product [Schistosoma turkestanicum]
MDIKSSFKCLYKNLFKNIISSYLFYALFSNLGEALCDFWICSDVLCCTASILHLVGIALDRYWAVTNAEYIRRRTGRRIGIMIGIFWFLSVLISIPARFHTTRSFNYGGYSSVVDLNEPPNCRINQEHGYTVFSNIGAFYMPMIFIIGIYARIYQVARARIRRSAFKQSGTTSLCMKQWKQSQSKQHQQSQSQPQHQNSFKQHFNTYWCFQCRNYKDRHSVKLIQSTNNPRSESNINPENPSSSHVADTDCTMIGRKTTSLTDIPIIAIMNNNTDNNNSTHYNSSNILMNRFNNIRASIPYADDVENKPSDNHHSNDKINMNENNFYYTKPNFIQYCERKPPINKDDKLITYDDKSCQCKHYIKLNHKEIKKSKSFYHRNYTLKLDSHEHRLICPHRNSAPPILVHLTTNNNNSSTFFSELTNSNSQQLTESSTEHTNSIIWSSSSSPLPSTTPSSSSFSESSSFLADNHYHYSRHHRHHQHHKHQRNHHLHPHSHPHPHAHHHHHHFHRRLHPSSSVNRKRNELKKSTKDQNQNLDGLKIFQRCCCACYGCCSGCGGSPSPSSGSSQHHHHHHHNHHQLNKTNLLPDENSTVNIRKYCCLNEQKNYTAPSKNNNNNNNNNNDNCGMYLDSLNQNLKYSHAYHKQDTITPTITEPPPPPTSTTTNNNNSSIKKHVKTGNHVSLKLAKKQLNLRKNLCHMFNLHKNKTSNNNNNDSVYSNKHILLTQSTSNLTSQIHSNLSTMNTPTVTKELQLQSHRTTTTTTTLTTPINLQDETTITSNFISVQQQTQVNRERLEAKRERKAILTLAIITGCFLLCWLPFFIVALISPFTENFTITKFGQSMILWLGYSNSLLNPIIYTIFSPDFRNAFRKILFGRYNLRSLSR